MYNSDQVLGRQDSNLKAAHKRQKEVSHNEC